MKQNKKMMRAKNPTSSENVCLREREATSKLEKERNNIMEFNSFYII